MSFSGNAVTVVTSPAWGASSSANPVRMTAIGRVVDRAAYKPGWTFVVRERMDTFVGLSGVLVIELRTVNSDDPDGGDDFPVVHHFGVDPIALENDEAAKHWLLARVHDVERHEMREFFRIDGERFDPPGHGAGDNPYR